MGKQVKPAEQQKSVQDKALKVAAANEANLSLDKWKTDKMQSDRHVEEPERWDGMS